MVEKYIDLFEQGILEFRKIKIEYYSDKSKKYIKRICAPYDFSYGEEIRYSSKHFWFHDFEIYGGCHLVKKLPKDIKSMELLADNFDYKKIFPKEIEWKIKRTNWIY